MSTTEDLVKGCQERDMTVRVSVGLEQDYKLRVAAKKTGKKKPEVLREAIDAYCDKLNGGAA